MWYTERNHSVIKWAWSRAHLHALQKEIESFACSRLQSNNVVFQHSAWAVSREPCAVIRVDGGEWRLKGMRGVPACVPKRIACWCVFNLQFEHDRRAAQNQITNRHATCNESVCMQVVRPTGAQIQRVRDKHRSMTTKLIRALKQINTKFVCY